MSSCDDLLERIAACPAGAAGWREFEETCTELLAHLFVPPLQGPRIQARTLSGVERRDAIFANREFDISVTWGKLFFELAARLVLVEFKNYDKTEIGGDEIDQTRSYIRKHWGRFAIMCCNKSPGPTANVRRNTIFSDSGHVILFLLPNHLQEMCDLKTRGADPADLLVDLVEEFYLQHE